jgi:hypothetical protein
MIAAGSFFIPPSPVKVERTDNDLPLFEALAVPYTRKSQNTVIAGFLRAMKFKRRVKV